MWEKNGGTQGELQKSLREYKQKNAIIEMKKHTTGKKQ